MRRALAAPIVCLLGAGLALLLAAPLQAQEPDTRSIVPAVAAHGTADAGYDQGLWIRRGAFSLKLNATLQARFEAWRWDADQKPLDPFFESGDLSSGFSLPRATLKLSGTAPCSLAWYTELEFGSVGGSEIERRFGRPVAPRGPLVQSHAYDILREAWVEWSLSDLLSVRVGKVRTATTRQLMTPPEEQLFVDVALASAFVGSLMPGYTDRNRDYGLALNGRIGARNTWRYLLTLTNGDGGDDARNVLDRRSSDNLAFSARVNHAFWDPVGLTEGALRQNTCDRYGEIGAWVYLYADRADVPPTTITDAVRFGVDVALGYRGWSFTGAATWGHDESVGGPDASYAAYLAQLGYHVPHTAWGFALRWSHYDVDNPAPALAAFAGQQQPLGHGAVSEVGLAVNYYLNGHGNKLGVDVALVRGHGTGSTLLFDPYTGHPGSAGTTGVGDADYGLLLRLQWQLAL